MVSRPAELAQSANELPDTLPEDFNGWDGEAPPDEESGSADHGDSGESQTPVVVGNLSRLGRSAESDRLRGSLSAATEEFHPSVTERPRSLRPEPRVETKHRSTEFKAKIQQADEVLFNLAPADSEVQEKRKPRNRKLILAVSAGAVVLAIAAYSFSMLHSGKTAVAQPAVQTASSVAADASQAPAKPSAAVAKQAENLVASSNTPEPSNSQPASAEQDATPTETPVHVPSKMMNDQLSAPARIPKNQMVQNAPPPANFNPSGMENMGGIGSNAGIYSAKGQPRVVKSARPIAISSVVAGTLVVQKVTPQYPTVAKLARVSGTVILDLVIAKDGSLKELRVVSGPQMLWQPALDAVRRWRFRPYKLNNEPVDVETTVGVVFTL